MSKVFCIGFHKTGTTSLGTLLQAMGYRVQGSYRVRDPEFVGDLARGERAELMEVAARYDAFKDNPWTVCFRELDAQFPDSRFILTLRDTRAWIRSVVNHFGQQQQPDSPMRQWIYGSGTPLGHEALYAQRYEQHTRDVQEWFADRPRDLLCVDISAPEALERIGAFLEFELPADWRMPHANRRIP